MAPEDVIVEGEGTDAEMQSRVMELLEERGWVNHAHVQFAYELSPPPEAVGPYRVRITPPPDDEPVVRSS
jgi:hypothetical protein